VPLPAFVVEELERTPRVSDRYWFWTGRGTVESARKKWSKALADLFADAQVHGGHAHRFRDTMAVELLLAGTPIERVSILLGHSSVRITEKHYNPWNRARLVLERMAGTTGLGTSPHSDSAMKTRKLLILQRGTDGKKPLKEVVPPKRGTKKVHGADRDRRNERGGMATAPELRGITQGEALSHA